MGIKLNTSSQGNSVTVNVRGVKGQYFVGVLQAHKNAPSTYKKQDGSTRPHEIYEFILEDTDMVLTKKVGKEYEPVDGATVEACSIFAPTKLHNALSQAKKGDRIRIEYLGLGKATKMGGKPHEYDVEVL